MKKCSSKKIIVSVILIAAAFLICLSGKSLYDSKYSLICSEYSIESEKLTAPIRVVQLSDLHNSEFGVENQKLIDAVKVQKPDIIFITGDQLNAGDEDTSVAVDVVSALSEIAPTYFSLGNHEIMYQRNFNTDVTELFESAGATVLEMEYVDIEVNGQQIRIGGIYGYCLPEKYLKTNEADPEECEWLSDFQNTSRYTVLMCHMPTSWILSDGINEWNVNSVFSGHTHGGEIILPFIGGVYGPDFGFFPGKLEGVYYSENKDKVMILSRGLGTAQSVPRFNNIPEIVTVNFVPA